MMRTLTMMLTLCSLLLLTHVYAASPSFVEGKDYKQIAPSPGSVARFEVPKHKILVVEFFSYGCPWCFHLEPLLEDWLKKHGNTISFHRVPVSFEPGWDMYAKAYYAAEALGILHTLSPELFKAIQKDNKNLTTTEAMRGFFMAHGVSEEDVDSVFIHSPTISIEVDHAAELMKAYRIFQIPAIVVDGKYLVDAALAKGDEKRLLQIVDFLIAKQRVRLAKQDIKNASPTP